MPRHRPFTSSTATVAALLAVGLCATGCSSYATIRYLPQDGSGESTVEAKILSSDVNELVLRIEDGRTRVLQRQNVLDIDHPGQAATIAGGMAIGVGVLSIATGLVLQAFCPLYGTDDRTRGCAPFALAVFGVPGTALAGVGTSGVVWGQVNREESLSAAEAGAAEALRGSRSQPAGLTLSF